MSLRVFCDVCGKEGGPVWGTFDYSPGGGRHGVEAFHFCYRCVGAFRSLVVESVAKDGAPGMGRWMIREDEEKARAAA